MRLQYIKCYHLRGRVASVEFNGAKDFLWDGGWSGEMGSDRVETVLVGGIGEGDLLTVGGTVREATLSCHGGTFGSLRPRGTALLCGYAIASFIAVTIFLSSQLLGF